MGRAAGSLRLDDQLCFALYAATNAITRAYRPLLGKLGLTYPQYLVMLVLWQDGERSIRGIAQRLRLPPNAVTPLVDRLVAGGLVSRRRDANDRRIMHVALTDAGVELEREVSRAQHDVECRTGLDPSDLAELRDELHLLAERMASGEASSRSPSADEPAGSGFCRPSTP